MNPSSTRRLLAMNGSLLILLGVAAFWPTPGADAQPNVLPRARGEYTMVAGRTVMGGAEVVYIVDTLNRELIAVRWDQGRKALVGIGYRNLDADSAIAPAR
ncbi:hypothetical protein D4Q85_00905 [bacterium]|nr:MAG: hypothetical protein D4Q85_00905 [bacterium]